MHTESEWIISLCIRERSSPRTPQTSSVSPSHPRTKIVFRFFVSVVMNADANMACSFGTVLCVRV